MIDLSQRGAPAASGGGGGTTPGATTATNLGQGALGYSYDTKGRLLFEGRPTPFHKDVVALAADDWEDAAGNQIDEGLYKRWLAAGAPDATKFPPATAGPNSIPARANGVVGADLNVGDVLRAGGSSGSLVDDASIKAAWTEFKTGIDDGTKLKNLLGLEPTMPLPTSLVNKLVARDVDMIAAPDRITGQTVSDISAPTLGGPAVQEDTRVSDFDISGLQEIARGGGQLAEQVRAQNALAAMKASQVGAGIANQARAEERAAQRRSGALKAADLAFEGGLRATETLADKATAATTKLADLDAQKKSLQANLDAARRNNDADRIQDITKKLADLELEVRKTNADIAAGNADRGIDVQDRNIDNTTDISKSNAEIQAGNADRGLEADKGTIDLSLRAQDQEEKQRIERGRLRLDIQKSIEDSAKGLLDESGRQAALAIARKQLDIAIARLDLERDIEKRKEYEKDRAFWTTAITSLLAYAIPGPKVA
jgi:hypothetical protein